MDRKGPTLTLSIFTFLSDRTKTNEKGYYRLTHHAIVTICFFDIEDLLIEDFNRQNVLQELIIGETESVEVILAGIYGIYARFRCSGGVVESVIAANKSGSVCDDSETAP